MELYQLPLAVYAERQERLDHALLADVDVADHGHSYVYDAVHDRDAMAHLLRSFAADAPRRPEALAFHRLPGHELDLDAHSTLFSGEQSNSSVMFGEDSLLKVFRKVTPGINPDVVDPRGAHPGRLRQRRRALRLARDPGRAPAASRSSSRCSSSSCAPPATAGTSR